MTKLFLATPTFSGKVSLQYTASLAQTAVRCDERKIPLQIHLARATSLLVITRNEIIQDFLKTDATHLLFIDSDIRWQPDILFTWLDLNYDVIGKGNQINASLLEVDTLPLNMILIKRAVIEKVIKDTPELIYHTKSPDRPILHGLFSVEPIDGQLLSEEAYFSRLLRMSGFKLLADPTIA